MKSVMISEIVQAPRFSRLRGLSPLTAYGLTLAIGLPLLVLVLHLADPGAPLAAIVLPVMAGLALPLCISAPGRLEISTRFDAGHMRASLDAALSALGFVAAGTTPERVRYLKAASKAARAQAVSVRFHVHSLEVIGPLPTLRALQRALATSAPAPRCPLLSNRETVAGAMQIGDNAGRVAGMAE